MNKYGKDDAYRNLDRVNFWITNCDSKTSFLLALVSVLVGIFFANIKFSDSVEISVKTLGLLSDSDCLKAILSILFLLSVIVFLVLASLAIFNFLKALTASIDFKDENFVSKGTKQESILFFGAIIGKMDENKAFEKFHNETKQIVTEELLKDINSQTFINSMICNTKFNFYNKGISLLKYLIILLLLIIVPTMVLLNTL